MFSLQNNIFVQTAKVLKWFRFPVSFKKSLGMKTPNRTMFAQHLQTPVQSWLFYDNKECRSQSRCSLFSTRSIIRCHPLCSAVILLIPILLSSLFAKHVCVALPGSCSFTQKVGSVFHNVGDRSSQHKQGAGGRQISFFTAGEWASTACPLTSHMQRNQLINHSTLAGKLAGNLGATTSCPSGVSLSLSPSLSVSCSRVFNFVLFHIPVDPQSQSPSGSFSYPAKVHRV